MNNSEIEQFIIRFASEGAEKMEAEFKKLSVAEQDAVLAMTKAQSEATTRMQEEMSRRVALVKQKHDEMAKAEADATAKFEAEMERRSALAKQKYEEMAKAQEQLYTSAQVMGGALLAAAAGGFALIASSTQLAARVETLGVVTARVGQNIGMSEEEVRALEKSIQKLGITTQGSREAIAMMAQANLDLGRATDLARLAQDAAVVTGENSTETFQRLVYAISSGSVIMLRRMMLSADFEAAYKREAAAMGKQTDALTETEKVQIRMNEVLARGKNIAGVYEAAMDTAGKKVTSLTRHIEESKLALGEAWLPAYAQLIDFVTGSLKVWEGLSSEEHKGISETIGFVTGLLALNGVALMAYGTIGKLVSGFQATNAVLGMTTASVATLATTIVLPITLLTVMTKLAYEHIKAEQAHYDALKQISDQVVQTGASYEEYVKALNDAAEAEGKYIDAQGRARPKEKSAREVGYSNVYAPTVQLTPEQYYTEQYSYQANREEQIRRDQARQEAQAARAAASAAQVAARPSRGLAREELVRMQRFEYVQKMNEAAIAAENLSDANRILAAGLSGTLQKATENYTETITDLNWQYGETVKDLELAKKKYGEHSEKVADLTHKLDEVKEKQREAADAMKETTAQMIYQQAAAALDAGSALQLARSMGILSEADYAVSKVVMDMKTAYDANHDGIVQASEGSEEFVKKTEGVNRVVQTFIDAGLPLTIDNLGEAIGKLDLTKIENMNTSKILELITAEPQATGAVEAIDKKLGEVATTSTTTATTAETDFGKINTAADTTTNDHLEPARRKIEEIGAAIEALPLEKTVTINVVTTGSTNNNNPPSNIFGKSGLDMIVPPGYSNDTFPIFASSGERVVILTSQQQHMSGAKVGGGSAKLDIPNNGDIFIVNNFDRKAASMSMAQLALVRKRRLNDSMGG